MNGNIGWPTSQVTLIFNLNTTKHTLIPWTDPKTRAPNRSRDNSWIIQQIYRCIDGNTISIGMNSKIINCIINITNPELRSITFLMTATLIFESFLLPHGHFVEISWNGSNRIEINAIFTLFSNRNTQSHKSLVPLCLYNWSCWLIFQISPKSSEICWYKKKIVIIRKFF